MISASRERLLRFLRVPPDPAPPAGAPGSLQVFRGGRNLYKLRLARWGLGQLGAVVGIVFSVIFLDRLETSHQAEKARLATPAPTSPSTHPVNELRSTTPSDEEPSMAKGKPSPQKRARQAAARIQERTPDWFFPLLKFFEFVGILTFVAQIPFTFALVRLDYELRWYMVTDRSLRIRAGIATVQESTMSFANIQQVIVTQGPLERLLGIADVRVQSAGGGDSHAKGADDSLHTGVFHGVENANAIRDLILERLRRYREAGLGDPDEVRSPSAEPPPPPANTTALAAARALLAEARALRQQLT